MCLNFQVEVFRPCQWVEVATFVFTLASQVRDRKNQELRDLHEHFCSLWIHLSFCPCKQVFERVVSSLLFNNMGHPCLIVPILVHRQYALPSWVC